MSETGNYMQFPVGALYRGKPIDQVDHEEKSERIAGIMNYCIVDVGTTLRNKKPYEMVLAMAQRQAEKLGIELDEPSTNDLILLSGAEQLGIQVGHTTWSHYKNSHSFIIESASQTGGTQLCRLRKNICFDARDSEGWSWRDVATLAAVYTGIGSRQCARLSYDRIGSMALGFNGQKDRDAKKCKKHQLTDRQTKWTVDRLRDRGFFVCASPNRRHVYYSHRMNLVQLIEHLAQQAVQRSKLSAATITETIQKRQLEIAKNGKPI